MPKPCYLIYIISNYIEIDYTPEGSTEISIKILHGCEPDTNLVHWC